MDTTNREHPWCCHADLPRLIGDVQHALSAAPTGGEAGLLAWKGHVTEVASTLLAALTGDAR